MWPSVTYEELVWHIDPDEREFIPKSARRRIASTYRAAVPAQIAPLHLELPETLSVRIGELLVKLARFDEEQAARDYDLPALLLRSESAASSQIEHLTSSVRNVALAELTDDAPSNARIVQGNVAAMRTALSLVPDTSVSQILSIHKALIDPTGASFGGEVRQEQVWVGGTAYSPMVPFSFLNLLRGSRKRLMTSLRSRSEGTSTLSPRRRSPMRSSRPSIRLSTATGGRGAFFFTGFLCWKACSREARFPFPPACFTTSMLI